MLFVVSTPIGNLKDIGERAISVLRDADFIVCERPRHSLKLLSAFNIKPKFLVAFTEANKHSSIPKIISLLKSGKTACLIVDAGTPGVSDPGPDLVKACQDHGIEISSVPGPSALTAAMALTGERIDKFLFVGFLSRKQKEFKRQLEIAGANDLWLVGFESPFRIAKTVFLIPEDYFVILVAEISKIHEKVLKGSSREILEVFKTDKNLTKGEFVVFVRSKAESSKK